MEAPAVCEGAGGIYRGCGGGADDAAADGVPPALVHAHCRAAKLAVVQELRRARRALDAADLGMVSDATAALPLPPSASCTHRPGCHSRTAAFLASGTVFALHKDDAAAREERVKTGEPLRVRPLGVGSVLVRLASAHALVHAHAALLERIASFGTSGYGCHHGAMRLLVVCPVRQTDFLSRIMPPSELNPFLEAVDAANISAEFSLLDGSNRSATDFVADHLPVCPVANYKHRMHTALNNLWASVAIEAGAGTARESAT
eukprot:jgi/Tetstr1/456550/TSEL_043272.t1